MEKHDQWNRRAGGTIPRNHAPDILSISRIKADQPLPNRSGTLFRRFLSQQMAHPHQRQALAIRKMLFQLRCAGDRNDRVFVSQIKRVGMAIAAFVKISRSPSISSSHVLSISSTRRSVLRLRSTLRYGRKCRIRIRLFDPAASLYARRIIQLGASGILNASMRPGCRR